MCLFIFYGLCLIFITKSLFGSVILLLPEHFFSSNANPPFWIPIHIINPERPTECAVFNVKAGMYAHSCLISDI